MKKSQAEEFLDFANPHAWWLSAHDLHDQTVAAYYRRGKSTLTQFDAEKKVLLQLDGIDRSCFLLGSFSLENMLKALVVYENPDFVSNSKLARGLKSHDLCRLSKAVKNIKLYQSECKLVSVFSEAAVSWGRYPCGLSLLETRTAQSFTAEVFLAYDRLFSRLDRKARKLLEKGWVGPFGYYGRFTFGIEWSQRLVKDRCS